MASEPSIEAPLYAQKKGASPKSDGWWCQLPHATQVPGGLLPLRRDVAPLPQNFAIYQTVYAPAGTAKDESITANGPPAIVVEVKANSAVAPGKTARAPQFSSSRESGPQKGHHRERAHQWWADRRELVVSDDGCAQVPEPRVLRDRGRLRRAGFGGHRRGETRPTPLMAQRSVRRFRRRSSVGAVCAGVIVGLAPLVGSLPVGAASTTSSSGPTAVNGSSATTTTTSLTLALWAQRYEHDIGIMSDDVLVVVDDGKRAQRHVTKAKVKTTVNDCRTWASDAAKARTAAPPIPLAGAEQAWTSMIGRRPSARPIASPHCSMDRVVPPKTSRSEYRSSRRTKRP